eukprot:6244654-Pyramimonas_sp.AAC.1
MLRVLGKGFFAACIRARQPEQLPPEHHGYAQGRRRETLIMASMATAYTLRQLQCSYVDSFKDMTNAFPSVSWKHMELAAESMVRDRDIRLALQRIRRAQVLLPAAEGLLHFRPTEGGLMGDPFMVNCFPRAFAYAIEPWSSQLSAEDDADKKLKVKCPITDLIVDMSLHIYADDINKGILQHPPAEKEN